MSALQRAAVNMGYLTGEITPDGAVSTLQDAIGLGEMTAQSAPAGHPIHAAVQAAREALEDVDRTMAYSAVALAPGSRLWQEVDAALEAVYSAAGTVRNDPELGPARTIFSLPATLPPWAWIGGGLGLLALGVYLFKGKPK